MNMADLTPLLWLLLMCLPPVAFAFVLCALPRRAPDHGPMLAGNPLTASSGNGMPAHQPAVSDPLLRLTRIQSDSGLRAIVYGLRHLPIHQTAPILRRYLHSQDPELQLFSQAVLQDKQDRLQRDFARLTSPATTGSPANLASTIEAGLSLMDSPLTPDSEHAGIFRKLYPKAEQVLRSDISHPRALFTTARYCLRTHQISHARELHDRLEPGCPLQQELARLITHQAFILHPPEAMAAGYAIQ